jgi:hypothetical protein
MRRLSLIAASLLTGIALAACSGSAANPSAALTAAPTAAPSAVRAGGRMHPRCDQDFAFAPADLRSTATVTGRTRTALPTR